MQKGNSVIELPTIVLSGCDLNGKSQFYDSIIKLLVNDNAIRLGSDVCLRNFFSSENGKLNSHELKLIRNYYCWYKKFTKTDYCEIIKLSYQNGVLPEFFSIDELKNILVRNSQIENKVIIDSSIYNQLDELDKRLHFVKY